jgi:hypothetical protein
LNQSQNGGSLSYLSLPELGPSPPLPGLENSPDKGAGGSSSISIGLAHLHVAMIPSFYS